MFLISILPVVYSSLLTPTRGPLPWNDWNFIATTDVHGYIAGHGSTASGVYNATWADFSVFVDEMREIADKKNVELFVIDSGDTHDGTAIGDNVPVSGTYTQQIMKGVDYDVMSIGNHELYNDDVIDQTFNDFSKHYKSQYITSNVYYEANGSREVFGQKFRKFQGSKAFGFLFDFKHFGKHSYVNSVANEVKSEWFTDAISEAPDFFLIAGHIMLRYDYGKPAAKEWRSIISAIREIHATVPIIVFGGHLHKRDFMIFDEYVYGLSAGRYFETIGFLSLNREGKEIDRRYLDANTETLNYHINKPSYFKLAESSEKGILVKTKINEAEYLTNSTTVIGYCPQDFYTNRVRPDDPKSIYFLLGEVASKVWQKPDANPMYFIANSGGFRNDLYEGEFTFDMAYQASPFKNTPYVIENVPFEIIRRLRYALDHKWSYVHRRDACNSTYGYVTIDDLSFDNPGDDTFHCGFEYFDSGPAIYSPRILPDRPPTEKWDVVFPEYIERDVINVLSKEFNFNSARVGELVSYNGKKTSDLFVDIAKAFWQNKPETEEKKYPGELENSDNAESSPKSFFATILAFFLNLWNKIFHK